MLTEIGKFGENYNKKLEDIYKKEAVRIERCNNWNEKHIRSNWQRTRW